jgi:hypothetical protein
MNAPSEAGFEIHSETSGRHWVAWISPPGESRPYRSVLLVGGSREEAESKAREWAARTLEAQAGGEASS